MLPYIHFVLLILSQGLAGVYLSIWDTWHIDTNNYPHSNSQFRVTNWPNPQYACFLTVGGSQSTQRKPRQTQGEHANSTEKHPDPGLNPGPSCCEATVLATAPLCRCEVLHSVIWYIDTTYKVKWAPKCDTVASTLVNNTQSYAKEIR